MVVVPVVALSPVVVTLVVSASMVSVVATGPGELIPGVFSPVDVFPVVFSSFVTDVPVVALSPVVVKPVSLNDVSVVASSPGELIPSVVGSVVVSSVAFS